MQISMKTMLVLVLATAAKADDGTEQVTPIEKVIQLMNGMLEKGKSEKQAEQVQFAAYKQWCDNTIKQKTAAIKEANEQIEVLKADIQMYTADAEELQKQIAKAEEDVTVWNNDMKAATGVREIEKADYDAAHTDYSESIDALGRAIAVLKKQTPDKKQAALIQLKSSNLVPDYAKQRIEAFLAEDEDQDPEATASAPEANAYEFQSQGILDMLNDLIRKFKDERTTLEKEEADSRNAYEMLMNDMTKQVEFAEEGIEKDKLDKTKAMKAKAEAEGDLEETITTRDDDQKYLDDTSATCAQKAKDFELRQQLRAEEIEAIEKAIEIISSKAVSGAGAKHLPTLIQSKASAFAQLRSRASSTNPQQFQVAMFLEDRAKQLNSRILGALAERVEKDPFKKVKKMIKDLIDKLMQEAAEEAAHKGWCDAELATNYKTRKEKTDAVETLKSEIDELNASIAKLTEEITELSAAIADLDTAVAKATKMREEEKVKNAETIKDAQEAQTAVAQALTVLKDFYAKAGKATAFAQQPEVFDKPYKGMGGMAGGVVGMLEVIESDFARVQAETSAAEAQAAAEYKQFMHDSTVDKADKQRDMEHKKTKKENEEAAVVETTTDLEGTQKELDAALRYYDKLKPSCVDTGVSYEDRVARRKEEIQSLQEALKILSGEDI